MRRNVQAMRAAGMRTAAKMQPRAMPPEVSSRPSCRIIRTIARRCAPRGHADADLLSALSYRVIRADDLIRIVQLLRPWLGMSFDLHHINCAAAGHRERG